MVWIAPVEQRINDVVFSTFDHPDIHIETHSVNIIVKTDDIANVYFDSELIPPSSFNRVNGNAEYSYARLNISHGLHRIICNNGLNAHVYGFGSAKGYAYLAGSNAKNLSSHLTLNDETVLPYESFPFCPDQTLTFYADVNFNHYDLLWNFGDGTTSTENPATHTYHEQRAYNASLLITTDEGSCSEPASDTTFFYVDVTQQYSIQSDEVCEGELYTGHGFNDILIHNDTILVRLQDNPIHSECQDSVLVYINAKRHVTHEFDTVTCGKFVWNHTTYTESDDIAQTFPAFNGCDSIVTCHLLIETSVTGDTITHSDCDSYTWYGENYTRPGLYDYAVSSPSGCDTIKHLDLSLTYSPSPAKIHPDSSVVWSGIHDPDVSDTVYVVTNTEFFSFQYRFSVMESEHPECVWDRCIWTISKPSWEIVFDTIPLSSPDGYSSECKVYVSDHHNDYVILTATMNNDCGSNTRQIYLKSSFLGIDDSDNLSISLHPNPTNGMLTITSDKLHQAEITNLLGQQMLRVEGKGDDLHVDMTALPTGIYFVTVTDEEGCKCVRKVIKK